ncbi:hypothetical protein OGAPHI_005438 [Ogataea philodendri]|uniref:Uncharacterized protein n=1 Tax=Ogataea philodendri TaxID=1378263 RepID=A0A9P8NYR3_9ASCO|nr:uncharacterized protein OGAPHI_005438 [Ogataea philodendri]KAH3662190.1 hypothetical protein OGAPHI_005438 [Ogataea philodendri]
MVLVKMALTPSNGEVSTANPVRVWFKAKNDLELACTDMSSSLTNQYSGLTFAFTRLINDVLISASLPSLAFKSFERFGSSIDLACDLSLSFRSSLLEV